MARYKVHITVFKGPTGKTLALPTALYFLGDLCLAFGVLCLFVPIAGLLQGNLTALLLLLPLVRAAVFLIAGFVLKKYAKSSAQQRYAEDQEAAANQKKEQ